MKKLFSIFLVVLFTAYLAVSVSAGATNDAQYNIPKAAVAPTIDGKITDDEWNNALALKLNKDTTDAVAGTLDTCPESTFYWMWDDAGLYFFADVKDTTDPGSVLPQNNGSYNSLDGVQFCIYPDVTASGANVGDLYFWSLVIAEGGVAEIGEHFVFGTGGAGADVEDAVIAGTKNGTAYTVEAFMPKVCWGGSNKPLVIAEGTTFAMTNVIMEHDGTTQSLIIDSGWFDANISNKYTLTSDVAGHVKAPETEAAVVAEDVAAEEVAAVTTPAPAAQTGDIAAASSVILLACAAAVLVLNKKK